MIAERWEAARAATPREPFCVRLEVNLAGTEQFDAIAAVEEVGIPETAVTVVENILKHTNAMKRCDVMTEPRFATCELERFTLALEDPPPSVFGLSWQNLWTVPEQLVGTIADRKHAGVKRRYQLGDAHACR
jgi:hypothetical protein